MNDLARHYGVSILPARPYLPKDKASAESAVQVVERWLMARLRHTVLADVHAADAALAAVAALAQRTPLPEAATAAARVSSPRSTPRRCRRCRRSAGSERRSRPSRCTSDYHVEVQGHRYSVSHSLVGLKLEARITDALVELLHRGERVACHARSSRRGGFTTLDEPMPAAHRAHKERTPERLIHWGGDIGVNTGRFVTERLQRLRHPEHG